MTDKLQIPTPGAPRALKLPKVVDTKLRNGLRVVVVRKSGVPKVEVQLMIPIGRRSASAAPERLLAKTFTSGTSERSSVDIASELQRLGSWLNAGAGADHIGVNGSVLAPNLKPFLGLLAELLTDPAFPSDEISLQRARAVQEIQMARSQPQFVALEVMRKRLFGKHPYGVVQPQPEAMEKVGRAAVDRLFSDRVVPRGALLVLVGDVPQQRALDQVTDALSIWRGKSAAPTLDAPAPIKHGPMTIVDRPGSVQTNIRMAGAALPPGHEDAYALSVANAIFGGTFMSRLVQNIREDKGYTYSPHSGVQSMQRASVIEVSADVGTEVTGPSLVEIRYELGRMVSVDVEKDELEGAQRYLSGIRSIQIQSQRGLAGQLAQILAFGLDIDYLKNYSRRISAVTVDDVKRVSREYLAPNKLVGVLVGDASRISSEVEALEPVSVEAGT